MPEPRAHVCAKYPADNLGAPKSLIFWGDCPSHHLPALAEVRLFVSWNRKVKLGKGSTRLGYARHTETPGVPILSSRRRATENQGGRATRGTLWLVRTLASIQLVRIRLGRVQGSAHQHQAFSSVRYVRRRYHICDV